MTRRSVMIHLYVKKIGRLWCGVAFEDNRIFATAFANDEKETTRILLRQVPYGVGFQAGQGANSFAEEVLNTINAVFEGNDVSFSFEFAMDHISDYAKRVLRFTSLIPTGYVTSYGALARVDSGSPRAVGRVMATNPFAPLIPCHRVVAADMTLGGYGGGLKTKWEILQRENRGYKNAFEARIDGKALKLFPVCMLKPPRGSNTSVPS